MSTAFTNTLPDEWLFIDAVDVGIVPAHRLILDAYVLYSFRDEPLFRLDIFAAEGCFAFEEAIEWNGQLIIGLGNEVHFVSTATRRVNSTSLESYFGHLYPHPEFLLVASAERMFRFNKSGQVQWRSERIGIDGVVLNSVEDDCIYCEGEWDPPDGWRPFKLNLNTGRSA